MAWYTGTMVLFRSQMNGNAGTDVYVSWKIFMLQLTYSIMLLNTGPIEKEQKNSKLLNRVAK